MNMQTPLGMVQPNPVPYDPAVAARGARKAGPGDRPLPEGIEVCRRPRAHDSGPWGQSALSQLHHVQATVQLSEQPGQCRALAQAVGAEGAQ